MKDTLETLRHKIDQAGELGSVVRSMKALSASRIQQYEQAVKALESYDHIVQLGLYICLAQLQSLIKPDPFPKSKTGAVVLGAGQGLVGQFNDRMANYAKGVLDQLPGEKTVWAVGESIHSHLKDAGLTPVRTFEVPHSIHAITPLVGQVLLALEQALSNGSVSAIYLFYNSPRQGALYAPVNLQFVPLDTVWLQNLPIKQWMNNQVPEAVFHPTHTVKALIREYFFVTLFRACAESLASEHASRLAAMQRAEKNIRELLESLNLSYHQMRQNAIDEELFDLIAGGEAQRKKS